MLPHAERQIITYQMCHTVSGKDNLRETCESGNKVRRQDIQYSAMSDQERFDTNLSR